MSRAFIVLTLIAAFLVSSTAAAQTTTYPPNIKTMIANDSKTDCDAFAYSFTEGFKSAEADEASLKKHAACTNQEMGYMFGCGVMPTSATENMFIGPAAGNWWIVCAGVIFNAGDDSQFVSPLDFAMVSASNTRYDYTTGPFLMEPTMMFYGEQLPSGQNIEVYIAFEVPKTAQKPLRIEIAPMLDFTGEGETAIILVEKYVTV